MNKYRNVPVEVDGHCFDSKKEAARYGELKLLKRAGEVCGLELQPIFPIEIKNKKICTYKADFRYWDWASDAWITEDVKSPATRKNPTYRLKKKLVEAVYGIEIREV